MEIDFSHKIPPMLTSLIDVRNSVGDPDDRLLVPALLSTNNPPEIILAAVTTFLDSLGFEEDRPMSIEEIQGMNLIGPSYSHRNLLTLCIIEREIQLLREDPDAYVQNLVALVKECAKIDP